MKIQGAVIEEQGIKFGIVVVKKHIVNSPSKSNEFISSFLILFQGIPIVLMAEDSRGVPEYRGRKDIVNFLCNVDLSRIPWKEYTIN